MYPTDELVELVVTGVPVAERYPGRGGIALARSRFTTLPDLGRFLRAARPPSPARTGLPVNAARRPKRPPRIAIATPDIVGPIRNGGIGTAYTSLARVLAAAGHDVTILYTLGRHCENGTIDDWIERYRVDGIRLVPLPVPAGPPVVRGPRDSFGAYRYLAGQHFDVVHFPEWGGTAFCSVQAKHLGLALEDTQICVGVHSPTLWHDLEDRRTVERLDQLERDFLERQSVKLADVVVSPSHYLLRWLDEWGWEMPVRSYVQPNVSPVAGRPRSVDVPCSVDELVFFGRLESRKGIELFCDAVDRLAAAGNLVGRSVTFLGKIGQAAGQDGLDYVRERASRWTHAWRAIVDRNQSEAVHYLVSRPALAVMPSLADNMPNTVLECLGAGVPFVSTEVGGIPEMIVEGDHERTLVPPEAEALARVLSDRLAHGATASSPATSPDDVRKRWIAWHEAQVADELASRSPIQRQPLVSVCMATHDRPAFLAQALDSLRRQTYACFEVVLIDDGSETVEARNLLDRLEREFHECGWTLVRDQRRFPGAARNTAASLARGQYLLFMDDDNLAVPNEIETFVRAAESSGAAILTCAHDAFHGEDPPGDQASLSYRWMPVGGALPLALFVNCVGDTNMLVRREAFFSAGGFDEERGAGLFEDWAFFSKALVRGLRIELVPESLFLYRLGPHGFGQKSPLYLSYTRSLRPYIEVLGPEIGLALLYAAGVSRRLIAGASGNSEHDVPPAVVPPLHCPRPRFRERLHRSIVGTLGRSLVVGENGEHLAERFAAATSVDAFGPDRPSRLVPLHQVCVDAKGDRLELRSLGDEPQIVLAWSRPWMSGPLLVRLEISASVETVAQIFWKTLRLPFYCEPQSVRTHLSPGGNVKFLRVPASTVVGALRFDPAARPGNFIFRRLEIRTEGDRGRRD